MGIKEKVFDIFYSIKKICTVKGDTCNGCPFQTDKGCEMKRITGTYPISWKEVNHDQPDNKGS